MPRIFSDEEIEEVRERYLRLEKVDNETVEGILDLHAEYEGQGVEDAFHIKITASTPTSIHLPAVYEIGGRTQEIAKKWNISDLRNLHCGNDGVICLCVKQLEQEKLPSGATLFFFIENLVVPYLYALSLYEKTGIWLWGEYSHGGLGLLEFYVDNKKPLNTEDFTEVWPAIRREKEWKEYHKQIRNPSGKKACLCGSGKLFKSCHSKAWEGLCILTNELKRLGVNTRAIFL